MIPNVAKRKALVPNVEKLLRKQKSFNWQDTGILGLVHWDDPEGWYVEKGMRGVQGGEHLCTRGRFMLMYGKTNTIS